MKFLKYLWFLCYLMALVCFSSCEKHYTMEDLAGTWILESSKAPAPQPLVLTYLPDGVVIVGMPSLNQKKFKSKWVSVNNSYSMRGNLIMEKGGDAHTPSYRVTKRIDQLDSAHLTLTIKKHISNSIDQMAFQSPYQQTFRKAKGDESILMGTTWNMIQPTRGFRFVFKENHLYEFYEYKKDKWVLKSSNDGGWYLYGNLLCTNFFDDAMGKEERLTHVSSCVYIEIEDSIMFWETIDNTYPFSYILEKATD